jgi:hypothetical protein
MKLRKIYKVILAVIIFCRLYSFDSNGQPVPGIDENIPSLVTFGKSGSIEWGDDDFSQTFFIAIPPDFKDKFYIRLFDPDTGGENDELKGVWNTKMLYSVYGGKGVDPETNIESRGIQPTGGYKSGTLLSSKIFANDPQYDNKYFTFGPFISTQGDMNQKWNKFMFKIICDGLIGGDDGNLYRYFISRDPNNNIPIEGANAFTYEYTFRMWNDIKSVSHIYPYIDTGIVYVQQSNFDWDDDGEIMVVSRVRRGVTVPVSGQKTWEISKIAVQPGEVGSSLDFQFHKKQEYLIRNNNVVISLENQRGDNLKFFAAPIGGVPVYEPKPAARKIPPKK